MRSDVVNNGQFTSCISGFFSDSVFALGCLVDFIPFLAGLTCFPVCPGLVAGVSIGGSFDRQLLPGSGVPVASSWGCL